MAGMNSLMNLRVIPQTITAAMTIAPPLFEALNSDLNWFGRSITVFSSTVLSLTLPQPFSNIYRSIATSIGIGKLALEEHEKDHFVYQSANEALRGVHISVANIAASYGSSLVLPSNELAQGISLLLAPFFLNEAVNHFSLNSTTTERVASHASTVAIYVGLEQGASRQVTGKIPPTS